jgi:hypothetical protein
VFFNNLDTGGAEDDCAFCTSNTQAVDANPMLAPLGNYGGTTQTMLPLPGSAAICAVSKSLALNVSGNPLTTDQRGFPVGASSYCPAGSVDAGSVQTNYTAVAFTNIPSGGGGGGIGGNGGIVAYTALQNQIPSPAPNVSVTENGQNIGGVPVTLTDSSTTVSGLGPITTSDGLGASFNVEDSVAEDTTLSAMLTIVGTNTLTTSPTAALDVTGPPTVTSVSPASGLVAGGTVVIITGTSFTGATSVSFGGAPAMSFTVNSATSITATSPAGTGAVDVVVTNSSGSSATGAVDRFTYIPTLTLSSSPPPAATAETAYSQTLIASGGTAPYTYAVTAGALPAGLTLSSVGVISGTPTAAGSFNFTVTVTDSSGSKVAAFYTLTVNAGTATLTFAAVPAQTYGNPLFMVSARSASTGAITYSVMSGPATVVASTGVVTLTGAGAVTIEASQAAAAGYNSATAMTTIQAAKQATQTSVSASPTVTTPVQTVTLTATVSVTIAGTPATLTGTVIFLDNGVQLGAAVNAVNGVAQLVVPSLPAGATAVITATYSGDNNFVGSTSSNSASVVVSLLDFTFTNTGTAAYTAAPGAMATYNFALAPLYGSYPGAVSFRVTGLPAGATASFTPGSVAVGGGATPVVMTVQTASATAQNKSNSPFGRGIVLAFLLLPFVAKRSVREKMKSRMLLLVLLMAGVTATLTGCGSTNGFLLQSPQTYTLTITATSGTLQHNETVTLIVQ